MAYIYDIINTNNGNWAPVQTLKRQVQLPLSGGEEVVLPAARVRPLRGELVWLMDEAAAAAL